MIMQKAYVFTRGTQKITVIAESYDGAIDELKADVGDSKLAEWTYRDEPKPYLVEFRTQRHGTKYHTVANGISTKEAVEIACKQLGFVCDVEKWLFFIPASKTIDNKPACLDLEYVGRVGR